MRNIPYEYLSQFFENDTMTKKTLSMDSGPGMDWTDGGTVDSKI